MITYDGLYEIVEGLKTEPFFPKNEYYLAFRERWTREIAPALNENREKREISELESRRRLVD